MKFSVRNKFILSIIITSLLVLICTIIEIPWWKDLCLATNSILATAIVLGLCFFPSIMIYFTICGILLDQPKRRDAIESDIKDITILVAAYNEEEGIYETLKSISSQKYPKNIIVKVIDNNSKYFTGIFGSIIKYLATGDRSSLSNEDKILLLKIEREPSIVAYKKQLISAVKNNNESEINKIKKKIIAIIDRTKY